MLYKLTILAYLFVIVGGAVLPRDNENKDALMDPGLNPGCADDTQCDEGLTSLVVP